MIFLICGPTGAGKSELALKLAKTIQGEIINGDAFQVYQEFNIGTAKPSLEERKIVPHHLFDYINPRQNYSVFNYQKDARQIIESLIRQNKHIIVVGGTGLYQKATFYDYKFLNENKSFEMNDLIDKSNFELHEYLKQIDEEAARNIHVNNRKRVLRAIEIFRQNGEKKSMIIANQHHELLYDVCMIGLDLQRDKLYKLIDERIDKMMKNGLLNEVKALKDKYGTDIQAFQAIGYKEFIPYFNNEVSKQSAVDLVKQHSRNYAKRQMTFFKNQLPVVWFNTLDDAYEYALKKIREN